MEKSSKKYKYSCLTRKAPWRGQVLIFTVLWYFGSFSALSQSFGEHFSPASAQRRARGQCQSNPHLQNNSSPGKHPVCLRGNNLDDSEPSFFPSATEWIGVSSRPKAVLTSHCCFAIGQMILAGLSYGIRNWRLLEIAGSVPVFIFFFFIR